MIDKNPLVLAYLGDAIYELKIREALINQNISKVNKLQNEAINFVSSKNQARFLDEIVKNVNLSEKEMDTIKRARNSKVSSHPKNTDILTYKHATAFEALIGYLYLNNDLEKLNEIINFIMKR